MHDAARLSGYAFSDATLGDLMPLFLWLDSDCLIRGAGPTLRKLLGDGVIGKDLESVFMLRRPRRSGGALRLVHAQRVSMTLRAPPGTRFKGVAVPLQGQDGALVNLSFGYAVRDAVRDHGLSATDFAATDLAIELLYLAEAKAAVMGEVTKMAARLKGAKARAEEEALTDVLTGLGNRRALEARMERYLNAGQGFALLHIDLDHFKQVNDTLGHAAGDHVLAEIAVKLRASARIGDLVARIGGDEFVVLLAGVQDLGPVRRVGERIFHEMRDPIHYHGTPCQISLSIGAVFADPTQSCAPASVLAMADRALYASKGAGRARMTLFSESGVVQEVLSVARVG